MKIIIDTKTGELKVNDRTFTTFTDSHGVAQIKGLTAEEELNTLAGIQLVALSEIAGLLADTRKMIDGERMADQTGSWDVIYNERVLDDIQEALL